MRSTAADSPSPRTNSTDTLTFDNSDDANHKTVTVVKGNHSIDVPVDLAANTTISSAAGTTLTVTGNISETGIGAKSLAKEGNGLLILAGANTYTGDTVVSGGTLRLQAAPSSVPAGAIAWLDASTLTLGNGEAVISVVNKGTLGGTFIVNSDTPSYVAAGLNGKGTINFVGTDGLKTSADLGLTSNSVSLFAVMRRNTADGRGSIAIGDGAFYHHALGIGDHPEGLWCPTVYGDGPVVADARSAGTYDLIDFVHQSETGFHRGYLNGTLIGQGGSDSSLETGPLYIGKTPLTESEINSDVAEVLLYNSALTDTQRQQVEAYLNAKWFGIGVTSNILPINTAVTIATNSVLDVNGTSQRIGSLAGEGDVTLGTGTLTVNSTADSAFAGAISGDGMFVKDGASTLALSGVNNYMGGTVVNNGVLQIDSADAMVDGGNVVVGENGVLKLTSSVTKAVKIGRLTMIIGSGASGLSAMAANSAPVAPVPEPGTLVLLAAGALALAASRWRRRKTART